MNNIIPCLIAALTRSHTINKTMRETNEQQNKQKNSVKKQSEETLTTQIYFPLAEKRWGIIVLRSDNKLSEGSNNDAKFKNHPEIFKPNIYKRPKNHYF